LALKEEIEKCSGCGKWLTADELIANPQLKLIGMARRAHDPGRAYYFFTHDVPECGTSLLIEADKFKPYINEYAKHGHIIECACSDEFCVHISKLENCGRKCFLEHYRNFFFRMLTLKQQTEDQEIIAANEINNR
jgi:hypothetical protein